MRRIRGEKIRNDYMNQRERVMWYQWWKRANAKWKRESMEKVIIRFLVSCWRGSGERRCIMVGKVCANQIPL